MKGKDKCKALKEIRRQIAKKNDIPYVVSQCKYQGDCSGTCPKCEAELRYLEKELAIRQGLGKAAAVAGISISVCSFLTACGSESKGSEPDSGYEDLSGNVEIAPETNTEDTETDKSDSFKESEQNSPENEEELPITYELEGDIKIDPEN